LTSTRKPAATLAAAQPLLRAICADPENDEPRLIYADRLDDQGYCDQAEYIRAAVAIARMSSEERDRAEELVGRAGDLYWAGRCEWGWPLGASDSWRVTSAHFRRGFPQEVTLGKKVFLDNATTMFGLHPITSVSFTGAGRFYRSDTLLDAGLTTRGRRWQRVPGPVFEFLADVGAPCSVQGAEARFDRPVRVQTVVSRAAVAYGRSAAGLKALTWPPLT
jgi:uncharacterized protein (TIGR02996 family)